MFRNIKLRTITIEREREKERERKTKWIKHNWTVNKLGGKKRVRRTQHIRKLTIVSRRRRARWSLVHPPRHPTLSVRLTVFIQNTCPKILIGLYKVEMNLNTIYIMF